VDPRQPAVEPAVPVQPVASRVRIPKLRRQGRSSNPAYTQITAYVPNEQHLDVKQQLLRQGNRDLSDLVEELFKAWLAAGAPRYATVQKADSIGRT
jgi:hypothetical protein